MMRFNRGKWVLAAGAVAVVASLLVAAPAHAVDKRELQAREAFAANRYQEALEIFAKLYAEKLHPTYLRNIGRCYQNLGDPDKAISSFREYLRKAKGLKPEDRTEVEGYIKEMEDLKKQRAVDASNPPPHTEPPGAGGSGGAVTPPPPPPPNDGTTGGGASNVITKPLPPPPPPKEQSAPVYKKAWFWVLIGAVVIGAGVGVAAATGNLKRTEDAPCMGTCL